MPVLSSSDGTLRDNISASDIKYLLSSPANIPDTLQMTVSQYLTTAVRKNDSSTHREVITTEKDASLENLLDEFVRYGLHRIYIVEDKEKEKGKKMIGVITLGDIINQLEGDDLRGQQSVSYSVGV